MKLFFCDIDGTFQDLGQPIPEINKQAVNKVQESGHRFVFVTGRGLELVDDLLHSEGIECDVIYGNGAGIKPVNQAAHLRHPLSKQETKRILDYLNGYHPYYFIHTTTGVYGPNPAEYAEEFTELEQKLIHDLGDTGQIIADYKINYFHEECQVVEDWSMFLADDTREIIKIELMDGNDEKLAAIVENWVGFDEIIFQSFTQTLEIVNPLATKGAAIEEYMRAYPQSQSFGIGDGENDRAMFEVVDVAVAVANASEEIQALCDKVIGHSQAGAVGHFLMSELEAEDEQHL